MAKTPVTISWSIIALGLVLDVLLASSRLLPRNGTTVVVVKDENVQSEAISFMMVFSFNIYFFVVGSSTNRCIFVVYWRPPLDRYLLRDWNGWGDNNLGEINSATLRVASCVRGTPPEPSSWMFGIFNVSFPGTTNNFDDEVDCINWIMWFFLARLPEHSSIVQERLFWPKEMFILICRVQYWMSCAAPPQSRCFALRISGLLGSFVFLLVHMVTSAACDVLDPEVPTLLWQIKVYIFLSSRESDGSFRIPSGGRGSGEPLCVCLFTDSVKEYW